MTLYKKEFYLVELSDQEGLDSTSEKELREAIVEGLVAGLRYISVVTPDGTNRADLGDDTAEDIEIDEYILVVDDKDKIDIEKTADLVAKDMMLNGMIICMRNAYEEIQASNGSWIDKILGDGNDA